MQRSLSKMMLAACAASLCLASAVTSAQAEQETFTAPKVEVIISGVVKNQIRVDWCWRHQRTCGTGAAKLFCKKMGFPTLHDMKKAPNLPITVSVGDNVICNQGQCDGFAYIVCKKD